MELNKNKATSGIFCVPLTDCINSSFLNGIFPDELKLANVTRLHKKIDSDDKNNTH